MGIALAIIDIIPASSAEGVGGLPFVALFLLGLTLVALASGLAAYDIVSVALSRTGAAAASAVIGGIALVPLLSRPGADLRWLTIYVVVLGLAWVALRRTAASLVFLVMASAGALAWMALPLVRTGVGI